MSIIVSPDLLTTEQRERLDRHVEELHLDLEQRAALARAMLTGLHVEEAWVVEARRRSA